MAEKDFKKDAVFIVGVVIVLAAVALILARQPPSLNTGSSDQVVSGGNQDYPDVYHEDSCRCVEKERSICLENFYYNSTRELCVNPTEKTVTYATLRCSVYECSGTSHVFDVENKEWVSRGAE